MMDNHSRHMAHALRLGRRGMGRCWPNPAVGCVLVKGARVVGRGWTQPGGRPHAETEALRQAGAQARGATAYVTLEPCAHHGQTPPCAEALIRAGIARVVAPFEDRDPRVSGKGFAMLRKAGIEVVTGPGRDEATRDHAGFFLRQEANRPFVTLKLAASLDGRIATATGESQWITGPEARRMVHALRASHDAVMVGGGTARADDPALTVRDFGDAHQPVRVILSRRLDLPLMSNLATTAKDLPVWLCHGPDAEPELRSAWESLGATLIECGVSGGQLDVSSVMAALAARGLTRVFCEGGGQVAASLLGADLVDELMTFSAGVALGAEGHPSLGALGIERLSDAPRLRLGGVRPVGGDVMHLWRRITG